NMDVTNITLKNAMNITITNNYLNASQKRLKSARLTRPPRASLGEIIWRVVRTSSQPITNLHLQNQAYCFESLELSAAKVTEIDT
ncbi:hypothetical protein ONQ87_24880, partial [Salmonella enterica subsp. enterica serovar Virginia]|nr:hypothetical protein [Salmonella enterica subsp. enterica serovar Virginia]